MNVQLLTHTNEPERVIHTAAKTTVRDELPENIWKENFTDSDIEKLFRHLYLSGHHSIFEHISFTFAISGVTRQTTHQLVRHRHGSYSQQSLRYVTPFNLTFDTLAGKEYESDIRSIYFDIINNGEKKEDARRVLPIGTHTNIVVTFNLRALIDMASERRCIYAQREFRDVVNAMKTEVGKVFKIFGRAMAIKCQRLGYCPEMRNADNQFCTIRPHFDKTNLRGIRLI